MANGILGLGSILDLVRRIEPLFTGKMLINVTERLMNSMGETIKAYRGIDKAASEMVKSLGGGVNAIREISRATLSAVHDLELAKRYNITAEELIRAQKGYAEALGRNVRLSKGQIDENGNYIDDTSQYETMAAMLKVFGEQTTTDMLQNMELFGLGIDDVSKRSTDMFKTAQKSGISLSKYTDTVVKNMKMAQNFTFKNGLKGLESMAKKAVELKMDMAQVEAFANKVNSLEGAVTTSAKLQVLGGPFAQFADPLAMMREGIMDVESLQDRMIKMVENLGSFDKRTGEIHLSSFDRFRLRTAAESMGVNYNELYTAAQSKARQNEIERQIKDQVGGSAFNKDFLEFVKNTAQFRNGQAILADANGREYTMEQLVNQPGLQEQLMKEGQDERKDIKDIALSVMSIDEKMEGFINQMITGKAYAESEYRYRSGGRTGVQNITQFLEEGFEPGTLNKAGEAFDSLSHLYGSVLQDILKTGLPEASKAPEVLDDILDFLRNLTGLNLGGINFEGNGSEPLTEESFKGFFEGLSESYYNSDWLTQFRSLFGGGSNEGTSSVPPVEGFATGGTISGPSHAKGGVPLVAEGGEFIVNKNTMNDYGPLIESLNKQGAQQYHLGGYVGAPGRMTTLQMAMKDTNTDILKSIDLTLKSFDIPRFTVTPVEGNGIQTGYRVSRTEEAAKKEEEEKAPKEINVNIKMSDLFVRGDGSGNVDMQSLVNNDDFVKKVKEIILESMDRKSDKAEKKF